MTEQSIISDDMTLKRLFQDFYRVPDYQREYVWGQTNPKGEGGEEVDQFLTDIYAEYENATKDFAPEYFIGTIVVCLGKDDVFELIDGQQRTTTAYLTLCATPSTNSVKHCQKSSRGRLRQAPSIGKARASHAIGWSFSMRTRAACLSNTPKATARRPTRN